jgi:hypothetical protein
MIFILIIPVHPVILGEFLPALKNLFHSCIRSLYSGEYAVVGEKFNLFLRAEKFKIRRFRRWLRRRFVSNRSPFKGGFN